MTAGTYASVKVLDHSAERIREFVKKHRLPRSFEDRQPLHATLIWSRRECPDMVPDIDRNYFATVEGYTVFFSEGKQRLVMLLKSPQLVERHKQLMREHNATYDYPEYHPHVTIAYDIGTFPWWSLPKFEHDIWLGDENVRPGNDRKQVVRPRWKLIQKILSEAA